ncbi:MAG: GNAT family N-acetyltransferase [Candidatus Heimdallarchaeota archaeon]|nr:GNAT family N-acetyltransferase [Candidatus Heimdallarchaeota archaeon]
MKKLSYLSFPLKEIPNKYLLSLAILMQKYESEWQQSQITSVEYYLLQLSYPRNKFDSLWTLAFDDELVGYAKIEWRTKDQNTDRGEFQLYMLDEYLEFIPDLMNSLLIPPSIRLIIPWVVKDGNVDKIIQNNKFPVAYEENMAVSMIKQFTSEKIDAKLAHINASLAIKGYSVRVYEDAKFDGIDLEAFSKMYQAIVNDMPLEELTAEQLSLDWQRLSEFFEYNRSIGCTFITAIASKGDELVGVSQTMLNIHNPKVSEQGDTGVLDNHRGNGLGLAMKYNILRRLLDTDVDYWITGTADSNTHMRQVNEQLGYESMYIAREYEIEVDRWKF